MRVNFKLLIWHLCLLLTNRGGVGHVEQLLPPAAVPCISQCQADWQGTRAFAAESSRELAAAQQEHCQHGWAGGEGGLPVPCWANTARHTHKTRMHQSKFKVWCFPEAVCCYFTMCEVQVCWASHLYKSLSPCPWPPPAPQIIMSVPKHLDW